MHDRRIDGKVNVFGNAGALFMNAMTWYDHETESIWSQPWGRAIQGDLKGAELFVLPSRVITWGDWQAEHPETLVMMNDVDRLSFRQEFDPGFVIGLLLDGRARAYYYTNVAEKTIINDENWRLENWRLKVTCGQSPIPNLPISNLPISNLPISNL
ncbi:MAG: DUF3179 domain-containing protein [Chloroflexi bacterium]|nr:DUF3179 domain-containing protein [Chloroflexota bacterium]